MVKSSGGLAVFLAVCVLTQHFTMAVRDTALRRSSELTAKRTYEVEEQDKELQSLDTPDETEKPHRRYKRANWWKIVRNGIIAADLITSTGAISYEVYLTIEGCCGPYPDACTNKNDFLNNEKPKLIANSEKLDIQSLQINNLLERVKQCNDNNRDIWSQIQKLKTFTDDIVNTLDPSIITKFNNKQHYIKQQIAAKNRTVLEMTLEQLDGDYQSMFYDAEAMAWTMAGILGDVVVNFARFAMRENKVSKMSGTLNTEYGKKLQNARLQKVLGVTDNNIKAHMKNTARGVFDRKTKHTSKLKKFATRSTYALSALTAGVQIMGAILKTMQCQAVRDKTAESLRKIKTANRELLDELRNVSVFHQTLTVEGWDYVKGQVTGDSFTQVLKDVGNVTKNAGQQSKNLTDAYKTINDFVANIKGASLHDTYYLQRRLIKALRVANYPFECYYSKIRLVRNVMDECRRGSDSMLNLFNKGKTNYPKFNSEDCRNRAGVAYTFFADVNKIVGKTMIENGLQADCILNNKQTKLQACFLKDGEGSDAAEISKRLHITEVQAKHFIKDCPPRTRLTTKEKKQVCSLRNKGLSDEAIAKDVLNVTHLLPQVKNVTGCPPPPPLTKAENDTVCDYRKTYGLPDDKIASLMKKPLYQIQAVICPTVPTTTAAPTTIPPLTDKEKAQVCEMRKKYGMPDNVIAGIINKPKAMVEAVTCPSPTPTASQPLSEATKKKVCEMEGYGMTRPAIAGILGKPVDQVKAVKCPRP